MARGPRQETITLAAGQRLPFPASGRWLLILSNTVGTVDVQFDNDAFTPMSAGISYPAAGGQFDRVTFQETTGAAATLVVCFSDEQAPDNRGSPLMPAIAADIAAMEQELSGGPATSQLADTVCPITPGPGVLVFAANTARTEVEITAPPKNGAGVVYLGVTAARASLADNFKVLRAGESWWSEREKGEIFASSSTGAEVVNGKEC